MITLLIDKFKGWLAALVIFISLISSVYLKGILKGRKQIKDKIEENNRRASEERNKIDENVKKANNSELDERASRWVRDN